MQIPFILRFLEEAKDFSPFQRVGYQGITRPRRDPAHSHPPGPRSSTSTVITFSPPTHRVGLLYSRSPPFRITIDPSCFPDFHKNARRSDYAKHHGSYNYYFLLSTYIPYTVNFLSPLADPTFHVPDMLAANIYTHTRAFTQTMNF